MSIKDLFGRPLHIINVGAPSFKAELEEQGCDVLQMQWTPPAGGNAALLPVLDRFAAAEPVAAANKEAARRIADSLPVLIDIQPALQAIPGMAPDMILHSGPPIAWADMCGPMQGAVIGALIYEGRAANEEEARELAVSGRIRFKPCNELGAVGPMAGVVSPSMPVHIVENRAFGNRAYCTVNEGLGKVLRFGAFDETVIRHLKWIESEYAPALAKALAQAKEGIDIRLLIAQAVQMGDECHNRNKAATSLFFKEITPLFLDSGCSPDVIKRCLDFIRGNDHYFLNLSMPACKSALDAAHGVEGSTVVTVMARNGVSFGIQVSGLGKNQWFTAPANFVRGLLFPGYSDEDACPDLGDSAITETTGIGGFAMGASPAIVQFVGGTVADALSYSRSMYTITTVENKNFSLPPLDFKGVATGIDLLKVAEVNTLPVINTGIAHRTAGIGQIGAGIVHPPMECFVKALLEYEARYGGQSK